MTMLMSMDHPTKAQVSEILMGKVQTPSGTGTVPVSVRDFGGQMVHYNQLLAELLRWNLADFSNGCPPSSKTRQKRQPVKRRGKLVSNASLCRRGWALPSPLHLGAVN